MFKPLPVEGPHPTGGLAVTASTTTRSVFATLDARITSALLALRQARLAVAHSASAAALLQQQRAEENLNALLDYRNAVSHRSP